MKKLLGIVFVSLLLLFPLSINNSYSFFDTPVEKCMDRLQEKKIYITAAAKYCSKFTKESLKCMGMLEDKGIKLARRTVAKYRDVLGILPSSKRKKYF